MEKMNIIRRLFDQVTGVIRKMFIIVGIILLGVFLIWSFRFKYINAGNGIIYRINRWTGDIYHIEGPHAMQVNEVN